MRAPVHRKIEEAEEEEVVVAGEVVASRCVRSSDVRSCRR